MRIVQLLAENIKKLSVVEINPEGDLIQITGANGSGKSSVLDAIWWALAGTKSIQAQPIRKGAETARIRLKLGDLIVTRKFTASGSTIVVENADGARYPSPQRMLDDLIGALSFDPLAFTRMDPREQFNALRSVVKIETDIDALDKANEADFAKRTEVNRETKRLRASLATFTLADGDVPEKPIDTSALVDEIAKAGEHNASIERRRERREQTAATIAENRRQADALDEQLPRSIREIEEKRDDAVSELEAQIKQLQARVLSTKSEALHKIEELSARLTNDAAQLRREADDLQKKLDEAPPLPEPIDAAEVRQRLEAAQQTNREIEIRARYRKIEADAKASEDAAAALTAAMEGRAKQKLDAIAATKMPVDGLSFGEGAVLYNGVPFEQASSAEQLRVSCALAMAMNPKLRVLRIKDGSLLDEGGLRLLAELAAARDFQVWLERVDTSGKVGIVLEDGRVRLAEPQEEDAA